MRHNQRKHRAEYAPRPALSPREPVILRTAQAGSGGTAVSGGSNQAATVGQAGAGARKDGQLAPTRAPKYNTNAKRINGGMPITYYAPMERWTQTTDRTRSDAPRSQPQAITKPSIDGRTATGQNAIGEGIRQTAMQRASILRTTGAVDIRRRLEDTPETAPAYLQAGTPGPVWSQETNEHDHKTYGPNQNQF
jgi:hypothetical protein